MSLKVYKSSAGSGKTFTLVKEFLKLAIQNANSGGVKPIIALTFTNKAANEMKERIISSLVEFTTPEKRAENDMFKLLLNDVEIGLNEDELVRRSGFLLHQILHDYSSLSVSTLDKFSHQIIRTFAFDLGLSQSFDIELDEETLLREAIEGLIDKSEKDLDLRKFLIQFSISRIEADRTWRIEDELFEFSRFLLKEDSEDYLAPLSNFSLPDFIEKRNNLKKAVEGFEKELDSKAQEGFDIIEKAGLNSGDFFAGNQGGIPSYFKKIANRKYIFPLGKNLEKTLNQDQWYGGKAGADKRSRIDAIKDDLLACFNSINNKIESDIGTYVLQKSILKNLYATALINEVNQEFKLLKEQKNVLPISDFNKIIGEIVSNQEAPFIYERLGNHYRHFLIDEFQDTSQLQWQNLIPLIENSLAFAKNNLIVGDGKQAIYRWRGGEVMQFAKMPYLKGAENNPLLKNRLQFLGQFIQEEVLGTNYRSKQIVIKFNNQLFRNIANSQNELVNSIYKETEQQFLEKNTGGFVEVKIHDGKTSDLNFDEYNFSETIKAIEQSRELNYNWKDIAILCRSNRHLIALADELTQKGFPVISSEALLLKNSSKVRLMHTFFKLLLHPEDKHEQLRLVFLLKRVHGLNHDFFTIAKSIAENPSLANFSLLTAQLGFELNLNANSAKDIYEQFELALVQLKIDTSSDEYLLAMLNELHNFVQKNVASLYGFVEHFETKMEKLSLDLPEGMDAIKMLTIHKSKGLEFPVVIYPFADSKEKANDRLWLQMNGEIEGFKSFLINTNKDLAKTPYYHQIEEEKSLKFLDELNVFYVACTRAVNHLYIFSSNSRYYDFHRTLIPALEQMEAKQPDEFTYQFGEPMVNDVKSKESNLKQLVLESMYSFPEKDRFNYTQLADSFIDYDDPREYGILIHSILANIQNSSNFEDVVKQQCLKLGLEPQLEKRVVDEISGLLNNVEIAALFNGDEIYNEADFIDENKNLLRPDRVVLNKNSAVVIDYKTGEEEEKHFVQVQDYIKVVEQVFKVPTTGGLLYTDSKKWIEVR